MSCKFRHIRVLTFFFVALMVAPLIKSAIAPPSAAARDDHKAAKAPSTGGVVSPVDKRPATEHLVPPTPAGQQQDSRKSPHSAPGRPTPRAPRLGDRLLRQGDHGRDVRELQQGLDRLGWASRADGHYGRRTTRNVRRFEEHEGLRRDGQLSRHDATRLKERLGELPSDSPSSIDSQDSAYIQASSTVFPIQGPHTFGGTEAVFGSVRSGHIHQGQDVFAACGTPLVAAQGGKVIFSGVHRAAGNYIVIHSDLSGEDFVYMHLQMPSLLHASDSVSTGARIGAVGDTGNANGCHLHFELWSAPGWYQGGQPHDPLAQLKSWKLSAPIAQPTK